MMMIKQCNNMIGFNRYKQNISFFPFNNLFLGRNFDKNVNFNGNVKNNRGIVCGNDYVHVNNDGLYGDYMGSKRFLHLLTKSSPKSTIMNRDDCIVNSDNKLDVNSKYLLNSLSNSALKLILSSEGNRDYQNHMVSKRFLHSSSKLPINDDNNNNKGIVYSRLKWWWDSMNLPNSLTIARIVFTPYLAWLIIVDNRIDLAIVGCFFTGILDYFDGYFAKNWNMKTVLGSFLDPLADKIFIGTMIISLTYKGIFPYELALVIIGRDALLLSGSFIYRYFTKPKDVEFFAVEGEGVIEAKPTQLSRINTVLQMSAFGFAMTNSAWGLPSQEYLPYFYYLVATTTIGSGFQYLSLGSLQQTKTKP
jgi:cardiolipin synthase